MYEIRPEGHTGPVKTIHRNNLRPCPTRPCDQMLDDPGPQTDTAPFNSVRPMFLPVMLPLTEPVMQEQAEADFGQLPEPPPLEPQQEQAPVRRSQRSNLGNPPLRYRN